MSGRRERSRSREGAVVRCANCGGRGHEASQCPSPIIEDEGGGVPSDMGVFPAVRSPGRRRGEGAVSGYQPPFHGKCANCFRFGHRARDCPNATTCTKCFQSGHNSKECTVDQETCGRCRRIGHTAAACPNAIVCDKCGQPGHPAVWCGVTCRNCGQEGHMVRQCPMPPVCRNTAPVFTVWPYSSCIVVVVVVVVVGLWPTWAQVRRLSQQQQPARRAAEVDVAVAPPRRPVQCLQCLQYGHMARDCPNPRVCH
ncbi:hypothetical protein FOZ62_028076, partial [Perkinsus olseni]